MTIGWQRSCARISAKAGAMRKGTSTLASQGLSFLLLMITLLQARAAQASDLVEIVEANAGEVTVTCSQATCTTILMLSSTVNECTTIGVKVGDVSLPGVGSATVAVDPASATIDAFASIPVKLMTTLPVAGDYRGSMLVFGKGGETLARARLVVKHHPVPAAVEIVDLSPLVIVKGQTAADVLFSVRELAGQECEIAAPRLQGLVQGPERSRRQTDGQLWHGGRAAQPSIKLGPYAIEEFKLSLKGLDEPAEYEATLRIATNGAKATEARAKIFVRESAYLAYLMIFCGALLGLGLRVYRTRARPALIMLRRSKDLRRLFDALKPADSDSLKVWRLLSGQLTEAAAQIAWSEERESRQTLDLLDAKRELYIVWRREGRWLATLTKRPNQAALTQLRLALDDAEAALGTMPTKADTVERATMRLADAGRAASEAARQYVFELLQTLRAECSKDQGLATNLSGVITKIDELLSNAEATGKDQLDELVEKFDELRHEHTSAVAQNLSKILGTGVPAQLAAAFGATGWEELRARVDEQLRSIANAPSSRAAEHLQTALDLYLMGMVGALRVATLTLATKAAQAKNAHLINDLHKRATELDVSKDRRHAQMALAEMVGSLLILQPVDAPPEPDLAGEGRRVTIATGEAATATLPGPVLPADSKRLRPLATSPKLSDRLDFRLLIADGLVFLASLSAALLTGKHLLWEPSLTWGNAGDLATALIWGIGVQSVAGESFAGLAGLKSGAEKGLLE